MLELRTVRNIAAGRIQQDGVLGNHSVLKQRANVTESKYL